MSAAVESSGGPLVIIPAYNEAASVADVVRGAVSQGFQVLVVDDGSADLTAKLAAEAGAEVISNPVNCGKGASIKKAIEYVLATDRDPVVFMDADGQHRTEDLGRFLEAFKESGADLVIGTRMADNRCMPVIRKAANTVSSVVVSALAGTWVSDSQSGYRLISRRLLQKIAAIEDGGFEFESAMIIDAVRAGYTYREVPIPCIYGSERSHYKPINDSIKFVKLSLKKACQISLGRCGKKLR